jgi:hypothetical protein
MISKVLEMVKVINAEQTELSFEVACIHNIPGHFNTRTKLKFAVNAERWIVFLK